MTKISAARIDMQNGRVDNAILKRYSESLVGGGSGTNSGSAYTADISTGNIFFIVLNAATVTITLTNPPASGTYCSVTFIVQQDSTGGRTIVWPTRVFFGASSIGSQIASTYSVYHLFTFNGGNAWFGSLAATNM